MKSLILGEHPDLRNANLKQVNIYAQLTDTQLLVDSIAIFGGSTSDIPDGMCVIPANTMCSSNVGSMLVRRRRRRPNIDPTLVQHLVFVNGFSIKTSWGRNSGGSRN